MKSERSAIHLAVLMGLSLTIGPTKAGVVDVPDRLRRQAIQACTSDALRLCSATLPDEQATIACMAGEHERLTRPCRNIYDRVVRLLGR